MKWFDDLKIRLELQCSFVLVAVIAGMIGWIGFSKVSETQTSGARLYAERIMPVQDLVLATPAEAASTSQSISLAAVEVSSGASLQVASSEEASSSMEQMGSDIKQNAENAQQTDKIAAKSARAGEHGEGFAVVAAEVRKLAERSQRAAGEINHLSGTTVQVSERAAGMPNKLAPDIQKTSELVQEITAARREQDTGSEQINKTLQLLEKVIRQNASAAEKMASTTEELTGQADQLLNALGFFGTGKNGKDKRKSASSLNKLQDAAGQPVRVVASRKTVEIRNCFADAREQWRIG